MRLRPAPQNHKDTEMSLERKFGISPGRTLDARMSGMPRERRFVNPGDFYMESVEETS